MDRRNLASLFGAVLLAFLLAALAQAAEFSATVVTNSGGEERQSKIYVKGDKIRREFNNLGPMCRWANLL